MAGLGTYLVILIVVVVAIVIVFYGVRINAPSTSTTLPTTIMYTTQVYSTTMYTTMQTSVPSTATSTTTISQYCRSNSSNVWIYNGNFSTGTYFGWTVSGTGFGNAPLNLVAANANGDYYVNMWSGYNGQFAATTYAQKTYRTPGNISATFVVVEPYLNFQIYSPNSSAVYVELIPSNGTPIINHYDTLQEVNRTSEFADASIDMSAFMCQGVTIKIVSDAGPLSDQNVFIAVGNFYQSAYQQQSPSILVNSTQ